MDAPGLPADERLNRDQHPSRFLSLDMLRGIAALAVVILHLPTGPMLAPSAYLAVDFFFILSGFVICHAYDERIVRGGLSFEAFCRLRLIRFLPLYFLGTLIGILVVLAAILAERPSATGADATAIMILAALFFLPAPGTFQTLFPLNPPAWSLFFELLANAGYARARNLLSGRALPLVCSVFGAGLAVAAFRFGDLNIGHRWDSFWGGIARVGFGFSAGMLLFRMSRTAVVRNTVVLPWCAPFVLCGMLFAQVPDKWQGVYDLGAVLIGFPAVVTLAFRNPFPPSYARVAGYLGVSSFAVYILHAPIYRLANGFSTFTGASVTVVSVTAVFFLFALTPYLDRYFDKPIRRWLTFAFPGAVRPVSISRP